MVIDCCTQIFKFASRRCGRSKARLVFGKRLDRLCRPPLRIFTASGSRHISQDIGFKELAQFQKPLACFAWTRVSIDNVIIVDFQDVYDEDFRWMTAAASVWLVFFGEVFLELLF